MFWNTEHCILLWAMKKVQTKDEESSILLFMCDFLLLPVQGYYQE